MDKKTVLVCGGSILSEAITAQLKKLNDMDAPFIVMPDKPDVIINGVGYNEKPNPSNRYGKSYHLYKTLINDFFDTRPSDMPQYNLITEFELIQNKKSKLCRRHRDYIIRQFNRCYEKE